MILFGPLATLKVHTTLEGELALTEMLGVLKVLYQGRYALTEQVPSREWAIVGAFGDGVIPWQYRLEPIQASFEDMVSLNGAVLDTALRTQNYDKGFDKFVRTFNPAEELTAVVAVESGKQEDHAWAVVFKQGPRRCLLLDTTDGLSDEETLWVALSSWVSFQPRLAMPRHCPGNLFYPDAASHVFEESWQFLDDLSQMPTFSSKSPVCQSAMVSFSQGLSRLHFDGWIPHPVAEAPGKLAKIATNASISRVRPIADGPNQRDMHRSGAIQFGIGSLSFPMVGTALGAGTGSTDTCDAQGIPS
jgi:hypothetical protein